MENEAYTKKWLNDTLTEEERAQFEQTDDYRFVQRLSHALLQFKPPKYNVMAGQDELSEKRLKSSVAEIRPWFLWLKAAAVVLMALGVVWYFALDKSGPEEYLAANKMFVSLPDSSIVKLNNGSKLTFDPGKWNGVRQAFLEGEGYFVVKPGETFDIISQSAKVSVLGTSFNIIDRENYYEVQCYRGRVSVTSKQETVILTANQSYRIIDQKGELVSTKLSKVPHWLKGESAFQSVPYIQVIRELERQYDVSVDTDKINTKRQFTGKFTHSDLNLALESITAPLNIGFQVIGSQVRLIGDKK
ncbi:MAG: FecR domain-containing protein [Reichenbachiella sp.]|uniref:FecR family protein n=1 Tax=Reichenbachiella sp. TaxID=2184521 RepID=UPI003267D330